MKPIIVNGPGQKVFPNISNTDFSSSFKSVNYKIRVLNLFKNFKM